MDQNAAALAHYYHLRAQGVSPTDARAHVLQRFGMLINGQVPAAKDVTEKVPPREPMEFGEDFCKTVWGTSTGPAYGCPVKERL